MSKQQNTDDQMIILVDENGNEQLFKELFTFDSDDWGKSYIFIYPAEQENDDSVDIHSIYRLTMIKNGIWLKKF